MAATVEILVGAARQGKTPRLLQEYRQALQNSARGGTWGATLWLSPTHRARADVRERLLDTSLPVCFQPNVETFKDFAETILKWCPKDVTAITDVARTALLRSLIDELVQGGQLPHFRPIADTAGFLSLVDAFIAELKRDEIWPDHFAEACRLRGETAKDRELWLIYERYQQKLLAIDRYDEEGRFWSARSELSEGEVGPYGKVSLVVVDGFTDFTKTQYEILDKLAELTQRMLISLPVEAPLVRKDLFAKSHAALERLQKLPAKTIEIRNEQATGGVKDERAAFDHIADQLFGNPREIVPATDVRGVEIVATTGQLGEVEELAARVKHRLLDGVHPAEIVVAFRTLADYADIVSEVFSASGIPHFCETGTPLAQVPVIKALCAVIQLEEENWPFERVMSVTRSSYFRPSWSEIELEPARRAVGDSLRKLRIHADRETMIRATQARLEFEVQRRERERSASESSRQKSRYQEPDYASALNLLQKLSQSLEPWRRKRPLIEWIEALTAVAHELGLLRGLRLEAPAAELSESNCHDREAWLLFLQTLDHVNEIEELTGKSARKLSLSDIQNLLNELILPQTLDKRGEKHGRVRILEATQVRGLDVPHLFLAGLSEGSFPTVRNDDCLYNEAERRKLNEHGLALGHRSSRSQDEMLLFYGVVTRATQSLVLSYPSISASGQPLFPSPYLSTLRDLFDPDRLPLTVIEQLHPIPQVEDVQSSSGLRLAATHELTLGRPKLFRKLAEITELGPVARNILAGVDMAHMRFHSQGFTSFEGRLSLGRHAKLLGDRFPADYQFSATQLEAYAKCPFSFFLSDVLKIEPLDSPRAATDFLLRGMLLHSVLAHLHAELNESAEQPAKPGEESLVVSRFRGLVSEHLGRRVHATELQRILAEIEGRLLSEWAAAYEEQFRAYQEEFAEIWSAAPLPQKFEVPFGNAPDEEGETQGELRESLTIGKGKKQVRVRGRIDRIDVGWMNDRTVFNVIDYKSGMPPRFDLDDVRAGTSLQLALYTLAVARLNLAGRDALPFQMGYWSIREKGFVPGLKGKAIPFDENAINSLEQLLEEVLPTLVDGMRSGEYPVDSRVKDCTSRCAYSTICRVNQIRPLSEKLNKRRPV